ncbi:hypothetical protein [Paractinoplanes durhamensis]|uniref:Lectin n=1 Tax=Paractinoplanes durhamensis TaxID=113563 RepID=A0ABQ3YYV2_9ACTN|nr:hypothetical protein [Actinoplanes durhamensis]GIE02746.1 hypothetical protein Adu01nite_40960 [Actinoplanes durhamensis]
MPTIADYVVVQDSSETLPKSNGDIDHDFGKFSATGLASGRTVLMFRVNPSGTATLEVTLNGTSLLTQTFDTEPQRSWHEVIDDGILQATNNVLTVTRTAGPGSITVSDLVILYQATV